MPPTAEECFDQFLQDAKTRSEETTQKWEKKKTSLDSNFDDFYEQECLKMHPDLPEQALAVLRMLYSKAKDSIEAMFHTCSASQHEDVKYFGNRLGKTQLGVMNSHEHDLQISKEETTMAKVALKNFQDKVQKRMNDQPRSTRTRRGSRERRRSGNPGSGGISFETARRRSKKTRSSRSPDFSTYGPSNAAPKRQNQKLEPTVEPVTRNVATRSHARSPARDVSREQSAHPSPEASPPARDPSTSRKSRSPKSNLSHYEAFKDGKLDDIHPVMKGLFETASELNQEYEDNLVMVNDADLSGLENMDDDGDEWQDDEDYVPRRIFDELFARNSRLVDENRDLDEANEDLREKNDKFQEMVNGITNAKEGLEREIEELRLSLAPGRGLPADTNQTDVTTWASADPDLEIPSSPEETEQREVPAMPDTPPTAGKVKSPLSEPSSPSSHHNVSTDRSKLTSPVSPGPLDTGSSSGSIQDTPTQEGSFSSSGDGSKKSRSEPKPQTQPQDSQDSQESSGPRARTRGFEASAIFQYWLIVFFCWGLPFIQKRGIDSSLAAIFPVLTSYYLRFDRWMGRQVRKRLPSYASLFNAAIAMILTIGFLCLYVKTYNVYLVLLRERNMWLETNRMASTLMLKRAAMSSKVSVWGLSEEQGLIRGVGNFVEFMCWSLGITTLKNWILEECAVVCQFFNFGVLVLTTLFRIGIRKVKVALFGGP